MTASRTGVPARAEQVAGAVERAASGVAADVLEHPCLAAPVARAFPRTEAELCELLRLAAAHGWRVLPVGQGSKLGWSPPPARADLALSTARLTGVVAYEPADGTLTALPGTPMAELEARVRAGGHRLTPDVARPASATLGGVVAAGQSGVCRLRLGPVRNHVLGLRVAQPDGRVAKSGGRLVKNVTGFDLHRLHTGAHGALGVISEVSLRLFALPAYGAALSSAGLRLEDALAAAGRVLAARSEPLAVVIEAGLSDEEPHPRLHVLLSGRREAVERDLEAARDALGPSEPGQEAREGDAAEALRQRLRDLAPDARGSLFLHVTCRPSGLARTLEQVSEWLRAHDHPTTLLCHPGLATIDVPLGAALRDRAAGEAVRESARALRTALAPRARVELRGGPWALVEAPAAGPVLTLQRGLRAALDPTGLMASDRLRAGL